MSDEVSVPSRTPLHLRIVGAVSLLWSAFGAYDYLMTRIQNADHIRAMMPGADPAAVFAWVEGFPIWGVDASPSLIAAFHRNLPGMPTVCEPAEGSAGSKAAARRRGAARRKAAANRAAAGRIVTALRWRTATCHWRTAAAHGTGPAPRRCRPGGAR